MSSVSAQLHLGDKITVTIMEGRGEQLISRLETGLIVLFDQNSKYFDSLIPGEEVEGHVTVIHENYIILSPISASQAIQIVYVQADPNDDIIESLEEIIEELTGRAKVIPLALLRIIRLQQLQVKLLTGEA